MALPGKIRSIKQPNWTDQLHWTFHPHGRAVADVDKDYRISCTPGGFDAVTWHKGDAFNRSYFPTVVEALKSLDYRPDA